VLEQIALPRPIDVFLKLNTGMNRLGVSAADFPLALSRLRECVNVSEIVLMTHFACADDEKGVDWQLRIFRRLTIELGLPVSPANSPTCLRYQKLAADWARPGIMLYGASPFPEQTAEQLGLRPAMTLSSRIIAMQMLDAAASVGYGATFSATARMRVG